MQRRDGRRDPREPDRPEDAGRKVRRQEPGPLLIAAFRTYVDLDIEEIVHEIDEHVQHEPEREPVRHVAQRQRERQGERRARDEVPHLALLQSKDRGVGDDPRSVDQASPFRHLSRHRAR